MAREKKETLSSEWSFTVEADRIDKTPRHFDIESTAQARHDLARRLAVSAVDDLSASATVQREDHNMIYVHGVVKARLTQPCVVTGEPVVQDVEEGFEGWYADDDSPVSLSKIRHERSAGKSDRELPILDEREDPDPVINGKIDVGELATQYLALAVDPYPHQDGAMHDVTTDDVPLNKKSTRPNPFAVLKDWKKGEEGKE